MRASQESSALEKAWESRRLRGKLSILASSAKRTRSSKREARSTALRRLAREERSIWLMKVILDDMCVTPPLSKREIIDGGQDEVGINGRFFKLSAKGKGFVHEVVDEARTAAGIAADSGDSTEAEYGVGGAGAAEFMGNILFGFGIGEAGEIVVDNDALAQGLVYRFI